MEINFSLPSKPGVYLFKNKKGEPIYIGKAIDLKSRVRSYFTSSPPNVWVEQMITQVKKIDFILTQSDFEALILEAALIKKFKPKFNIRLKDDKRFLYIKITVQEKFPKVTTARREDDKKAIYFGPFPSAKKTRQVLRILRKIFPFCSQKTLGKRACFFHHLGLCSPCPSNIIKLKGKERRKATKKYRHNIAQIIRVLKGESKKILKELEEEMKKKALNQEFEQAAVIRDQLLKLKYIVQPREKVTSYLEDFDFLEKKWQKETEALFKLLTQFWQKKISYPYRIEGYDVSNIDGKWATGSMVVFCNGEEERREYRRFRIKFKDTPDDVAMIKEVIKRRFGHSEWELPQLVVVDGGKTQVAAAIKALAEKNLKLPVLGLAKKREEVVIPLSFSPKKLRFKVLKLSQNSAALSLLQRIRDEAHRFAKAYHLRLRFKNFFT